MQDKDHNDKISIVYNNSKSDKIQDLVVELLEVNRDIERDQPYSWSLKHIISCSQICKILASVRGINRETAAISGAIHDLAIIKTGKFDNHGPLGAPMVEEFLSNYNQKFGEKHGFLSQEEIDQIVQATRNHTLKKIFSENAFDELIKDADSLDRFLHGKKTFDFYYERSKEALKDMDLNIDNIL